MVVGRESFTNGVRDEPMIRRVDAREFATLLDAEAFVILAHAPLEPPIPGTDLVTARLRPLSSYRLPLDRDMKMLVYCRSGEFSGLAAQELEDLGYRHIIELKGGARAWRRAARNRAA